LRKLSEIFQNDEIKKLCGNTEESKQHSTEHTQDLLSSKSEHKKSNESLLSTSFLAQLKEELINGNRNDLFANSTTLKDKQDHMRLKLLDESIQSIHEHDLFNYNESVDRQEEKDEAPEKQEHSLSVPRLRK